MVLLQSNLGVLGNFKAWKVYPDGRRELAADVHNIVTNSGLQALLNNISASGAFIDSWAYGHSGVDISGNTIPKSATTSGLNAQDGAGSFVSYATVNNQIYFYATIPINSGNTPGSLNEFQIGIGYGGGSPAVCCAAQSFSTFTKNNTFAVSVQYSMTIVNV